MEKTEKHSTEHFRALRLFHYTKDYETLMEIIKNGLRCSLLYEKIPNPVILKDKKVETKRGDKLAYMVKCACMCDTPLSKVRSHVEIYGKYAIGFSSKKLDKTIAMPVIYSNADISGIDNDSERSEFYRSNWGITRRVKMVNGKFVKDGVDLDNVYFMDENEWRFFPVKDASKPSLHWYNNEDELQNMLKDEQKKVKYTKNDYIKFDILDDVEYIILEDKEDYARFLEDIKKDKKYEKRLEDILPKVLFYESLKRDL